MGMPGSETALEEVMCRVLGPLLQDAGFVRVMENLESHGISKKKFQAWKVMEFRSESWKVMENCYNLTFCKNRDENKENSLLSQVFV